MDNLFESFNNNTIETFNDCPKGYVPYGCPNPDVQSVHDGAGTYFVNSTSGSNTLPDPVKNPPGCVGWSVIVRGEGNQSVTTTIKTHVRRTDSPGVYAHHGYASKPDAFTFTDAAAVNKIKSEGNHYMSYCILPPPTPLSGFDFSKITTSGFTVGWVGGVGATSYTYTLNGTAAIPTIDGAFANNTVSFDGLKSATTYALIVTAVNLSGKVPGSSSVTLLVPTTAPAVTVPAAALVPSAVVPGAVLPSALTTPPALITPAAVTTPASALAGSAGAAVAAPEEEKPASNNMMYIGIGVGVVVLIIIGVMMSGGKKNNSDD
jgi:hypothetical protein